MRETERAIGGERERELLRELVLGIERERERERLKIRNCCLRQEEGEGKETESGSNIK